MRDYRRPVRPAPRQEPRESNPWALAFIWGIGTFAVLFGLLYGLFGKTTFSRHMSMTELVLTIAIAGLTVIVIKLWIAYHNLQEIVWDIFDGLQAHRENHPAAELPQELAENLHDLDKDVERLKNHSHPNGADQPPELEDPRRRRGGRI